MKENSKRRENRTGNGIGKLKLFVTALLAAVLLAAAPGTATEVQAAVRTKAQAASDLKKAMKNREASVTIMVKSGVTAQSIYDEAVSHTGISNEGDYLRWVSKDGFGMSQRGNRITFTLEYYDTLAQENELSKNLKTYSGNTIKMIQDIYYYTVTHAKYATSDGTNGQSFSAYGHYKGAAYCEGYATTLYYLMNKNGIPCRIITGTSVNTKGGKEEHSWNVIQYSGKWYCMDATWDSCLKKTSVSNYKYFMKSLSSFSKDHWATNADGYSASLVSGLKFSSSDYKVASTSTASSTKTYKVTVKGGSGSGTYKSGTVVTIKASAPAEGYVFSKWSGSASFTNGTKNTQSTAKIKVNKNVTLTASSKQNVATVSNGNYKVASKANANVLTVKGDSKAANAAVVGGKKNANSATFTVTKAGGGYYYFKNKRSQKFLSLKGTNAVQSNKNNTSKWKLLKVSSNVYKLSNQNGKVITLNGTKVTGNSTANGTKQRFALTK